MKKGLWLTLFMVIHHGAHAMAHKVDLNQAIEEAIRRYGLKTEPTLVQAFHRAHVEYPPAQIALLAFKKERNMELWAKDKNTQWHYIQSYPLTAFSGHLGPKLKERDGQIPEGIYRITAFKPFSSWHLSLMIDYPNDFDKIQAAKEGRHQLGSNIFLHGKAKSVGCLAVGDKAIDQLFILARRVGLSHVKLGIAPNDLRRSKPATTMFAQPHWVPELYKKIAESLSVYKSTRQKV